MIFSSLKPAFLLIGILLSGIILISFSTIKNGKYEAYRYHVEGHSIQADLSDFPIESNTLFTGSGNCLMCHGDPSQFPSSTANLDSAGNDVSPLSTWSATIMANASKDPFWRAKVQHEGLINSGLESTIETLCTKCHAPLGHFDALHNSLSTYTVEDLENDPLGLDGVSCNACHMIEDIDLGTSFSGSITYNEDHVEYGPYADPFQNPMINNIGFTPEEGVHISSAKACAKCHSLITHTITEDGELTDNSFIEQAIYHEWLNSSYSVEGRSCINCHMKTLNETIKLSPMPPWIDGRENYSKHDIAGGNVFMLNLLKNNAEELSLNASEAQFDDLISLTTSMLQDSALTLQLELVSFENDSALIELNLVNKSGHKLPSGYPSRKIMIELNVVSLSGDTLFSSGGFDSEGRILGESDSDFEEHYDLINDAGQVQLYEYVIGDEDDLPTTMLTRAYSAIKDNRIPPLGFSVDHSAYDTVQIIGNASLDPNFNLLNGDEGSGSDKVYYQFPIVDGLEGATVNAKVHYISIPRKWLDQLFEEDADKINEFETMYNAEESVSVIMAEESLTLNTVSIKDKERIELSIYPNPSSGNIIVYSDNILSQIEVFDVNGKLCFSFKAEKRRTVKIELPETQGKYILKIKLNNGEIVTKSVIKL